MGGFTRLVGFCLTIACFAPAASAQEVGQSPLAALRDFKHQAEWSDKFDATLPEVRAVNSLHPTLSPQALGRMELAIQNYRSIAASGGWPTVNSPKKALQLGARDSNVPTLRQRLMITGDLQERGGRQDVYDSYVAAAVRRFQLRHGLPDSLPGLANHFTTRWTHLFGLLLPLTVDLGLLGLDVLD